jgi:TolB-like protein
MMPDRPLEPNENAAAGGTTEPEEGAIQRELSRVLGSIAFRRAKRLRGLLEYAADPDARLNEEAVAAAVFGRVNDFDPRTDPLVRVEFGRLRRRLAEYYADEGKADPIRIVMPSRGYRLSFVPIHATAQNGEGEGRAHPVHEPGPPSRSAAGHQGPASNGSARSIAVIPFANLTGEKDRDVFCHGLTEELIRTLTEVEDIEVVSRTSAFQFKDGPLDVREVGRELGVDLILEGSVRMEEGRIRVIPELTSVKDGFVMWSEAFDHDGDGALDAQAAIAKAVHDTLQTQLASAA